MNQIESRTLIISDIDGTLLEFLYTEDNLSKSEKEFDQILSNQEPFDWVKTDIFQDYDSFIFITGRKKEKNNLTQSWIGNKVFNRNKKNFTIINTPYSNKEQYVTEKSDTIFRLLKTSKKYSRYVIIEDDLDVLKKLDKKIEKNIDLLKRNFLLKIEIYYINKEGIFGSYKYYRIK